MEDTANIGSEERPLYRYYLTRNRNLLAVRDQGPATKRIFALHVDDQRDDSVSPRENPFSGIH